MSLLAEFPEFEDLPNSQSTQIKWLGQAVGALKQEIAGLKGQVAASKTKGQEASDKGPQAEGVKILDLNQYPGMKAGGRLSVLCKHIKNLNAEPTWEECVAHLPYFLQPHRTNKTFAKDHKISTEAATAITYILKKRGWIKWVENPKGLVLTEAAPLKRTPTDD